MLSLLVLAAAGLVLAAAPGRAAEEKWQPHSEVAVRPGSLGIGVYLDQFIPLVQDDVSMFFLDLRLQNTDGEPIGNFGVGYRRIDAALGAIFGGYGFLDVKRSGNDNTFLQVGLGAELITRRFDFHLNGFVPATGDREVIDLGPFGAGTPVLDGNNLLLRQDGTHIDERPLAGVEAELGVTLPLGLPEGHELRAFVGGYHYFADSVDDVTGARGGLEFQYHDPFGLAGAVLSVGGTLSHDNRDGTEVVGEVRLRVPFGLFTGAAAPRLSGLDRRMTDQVRRTLDVVTRDRRTAISLDTPARDAAGVTYGGVFFADGANSAGAGTAADPTTLNDAVTRAGGNGVIVVEGNNGDVTTPGIVLTADQDLIGGGATVPVRLADNSIFDFPLGQLPGTIRGTDPLGDVVRLADGVTVAGLSITGGLRGLVADGVGNLAIDDLTVTGTAGDGISILNATGPVAFTGTTTVTGAGGDGVVLSGGSGAIGFELLNVDGMGLTGTGVAIRDTGGPVTIAGGSIAGVTDDGVNAMNIAALSLTDTTVAGGAGEALDLDTGAQDTDLVLNGSTLSSGGANVVDLNGNTGAGTLTVMSLADNTVLGGNGETGGIAVTGASFDDGAGGPAPGGNTVIGSAADRLNGNGLDLDDVSGTLEFASLEIANDMGDGLEVSNSKVNGFTVTAGGGSIDTTNGMALDLDPLVIDLTLESITATGGAFGILLANVEGSLTVTGQTMITDPTVAAIAFLGTVSPTLDLADLDVTLAMNGSVGLDLNNAKLTAPITIRDFDLSSSSATNTVAIDLRGVAGHQTIQVGDTAVGGESSSIAGVATGIFFNASSDALFTYGDGEAAVDQLSTIAATDPLNAASAPVMGEYNVLDVDFAATSPGPGFAFAQAFFFAEGAAGSGATLGDPGSIGAAEASAVAVLIPVGATTIDAGNGGGGGSLELDPAQALRGFPAPGGTILGAGLSGPPTILVSGGGDVVDTVGDGSPLLTTSAVVPIIVLSNGSVVTDIRTVGGDVAIDGTGVAGADLDEVTIQVPATAGLVFDGASGAVNVDDTAMVGGIVGVAIDSATASFNFTNLLVDSTAGAGIQLSGPGGVFNFNTVTIVNPGGPGLDVDQVTGDFTFTDLVVTGVTGTNDGVDIDLADQSPTLIFDNVSVVADPAHSGSAFRMDVTGAGAPALEFRNGGTFRGGQTAMWVQVFDPSADVEINLTGLTVQNYEPNALFDNSFAVFLVGENSTTSSLTVIGLAGIDVDTDAANGLSSGGIVIENARFDSDPSTPALDAVDAGSLTIGTPANRADDFGLFVANVDGTLSFDDLDIAVARVVTAGAVTGLGVDNTAINDFTMNVDPLGGANATIDVVDVNQGGFGLFLSHTTVNAVFQSISTVDNIRGLLLADVDGSFAVTGAVTIDNPLFNAIEIRGTSNVTVALADLDIALDANNSVGLDLAGATLSAGITIGDFDLTSTSAVGTVAIDLENATGGVAVRVGDADPMGESASIAGVETGVLLSAVTDLVFTYGDGEDAIDQGSTIQASVPIDASSAPVSGSYDFRDVGFQTSPGLGFGLGRIFFVDADGAAGGGDGSGADGANPATLADAEAAAAAGDIFVLLDNGSAISAAGSNADDTLLLQDNQQVLSFGAGPAEIALSTPPTIQLSGSGLSIDDPTGNGAAVLTTAAGMDAITLGAMGNRIVGLELDGDPAGAARGIVDNGGATNTTIADLEVRNFTAVGIEITPSTATSISDVSFQNNAQDLLLNAAGTTISNVTSTGATGTALQIDNATGITTLTNLSVTDSGGTGLVLTDATDTILATTITVTGSGGDGVAFLGGNALVLIEELVIVNPAGAALRLAGSPVPNLVVDDLEITLGTANSKGVDLSGATLVATVQFFDFDLTSTTATGTVAIDLSGTTGPLVQVGDFNINGESSTITGVGTGVLLDAATFIEFGFTYGDGEDTVDQGSTIDATVPIDASSAPVAGDYNFADVAFPLSPGLGFGIGTIYFVDATGGGSGLGPNDRTDLATAENASIADDVFVLVNDGNPITAAGSNMDDTLVLKDGQQVVSFRGGPATINLTVPSGFLLSSDVVTIVDPTGNGAATLTTDNGADAITLGSQDNRIAGLVLDGDPAGAARGINDGGGGSTDTLLENLLVRNFDTVGIEITPSFVTSISNVTFESNAQDILLNAFFTRISNVTSTNATGNAIEIVDASGTATLTDISIANAGGAGLVLSNAGDTVNATNVTVTDPGAQGLLIDGGSAAFSFTDLTVSGVDGAFDGIDIELAADSPTLLFDNATVVADATHTASAFRMDVTGAGAPRLAFQNGGTFRGGDVGLHVNVVNPGANVLVDVSGLTLQSYNNNGVSSALALFGSSSTTNTLTVAGLAGLDIDTDAANGLGSGGIVIFDAQFDSDPITGGLQEVQAGSMILGTPANRIAGAALHLTDVAGTLSFDDLDVAVGSPAIGFGVGIFFSPAFALNIDAADTADATVDVVLGDGIRLFNHDINANFEMVSATGGAGLMLSDVGGSIAVSGTMTIDNPDVAGIIILPSAGVPRTPVIDLADVDITLGTSGTSGIFFGDPLNLTAVTLTNPITIHDFDLASTTPGGTVGIDLFRARGGQTVRVGDTAAGGESASIAGVGIGVLLNGATNVLFTFGDGELAVDTASTISATVPIDAASAPVAGNYDFRDVAFAVSPGLGFGIGTIYFVDATGGGSGLAPNDRTDLATAENASVASDIFVLVDDGNPITAAGTNGDDTLALKDGQQVLSFRGGSATIDLNVPATIQLSANQIAIPDPTGNGAATLTTAANEDAITLAAMDNRIAGLVLDGDPAGAARGVNDNGGGATDTLLENLLVRNFATVGIEITPSTNTTLANVDFANNANDALFNAADTTLTDVTSTGAAGTAIEIQNATGTTTLTNVTIADAAGAGLTLNNAGGTVTATNVDISGTAGVALNVLGGDAAIGFDATSSIDVTGGTAVVVQGRSGGSLTFAGPVDANGAATAGIDVSGAAAPSDVSFTGQVRLGTASALSGGFGVSVDNNGQASTVGFSDLDVVTAGFGAIRAMGGGTFQVLTGTVDMTGLAGAAALTLQGIQADVTLTALSATDAVGLDLFGGSGSVEVTGQTTITNPASAAIFVQGASNPSLTLANVDIALNSNGTTGLDLSNATLTNPIAFGDFDLTSTTATGTTGIDLSGATGMVTVRIGDSAVGGASSSIAGVATGVLLTATTNIQSFVYGDGEDAVDQGSTIDAGVPIDATNPPTMGLYNFLDVDFPGSPGAGFGVGDIFYVDSDGATGGGDGSGSTAANPATLADAEAAAGTDDIFILINNGNPILTDASNGNDSLTLQAGQQVLSFAAGDATIDFSVPPTIQLSAGAIVIADPTLNGAAVLGATLGTETIVLADGNLLADFTLTGAGTGILGNGVTGLTVDNLTIDGTTGAIDLAGLMGTVTIQNSTLGAGTAIGGPGIQVAANGAGSMDVVLSGNSIRSTGAAFLTTDDGTQDILRLVLGGNSFERTTAGNAVSVTGSGANSTIVTDFLANAGEVLTVLANGTGGGVLFDRVSFDADPGDGTFNDDPVTANATGTQVILGQGTLAAERIQGNALFFQDPSGTLNLTEIDVFNNAGTGLGVDTKNLGTSFTLTNTVAASDIDTTTGTALDLDPLTTNLTFGTVISTSSAGGGVVFDTVNGVGGANAVTIGTLTVTGAAGTGLAISNATSGSFTFTGQVAVDNTATMGDAVVLTSNTGAAIGFNGGLNVDGALGSGLIATGGGTIGVAASAGEESVNVSGEAFVGVRLDGITLAAGGITFETINVNATNNGILFTNVASAGGGFVGGTGSIQNNTIRGIDIDGGGANFSYAGTVSTNATNAHAVEVTNRSGGTITLSGTVSDTGMGLNVSNNTGGSTTLSGSNNTFNTGTNAAVVLNNNTGHTINFTGGGLAVTTTSANAFSATNGGTVTVTGANNTVSSTTGTAVTISGNTTIGGSGVTFRSVSANGGTDGIVLSSTGAGAFTVTGSGTTDGSGGTIQNTQHGISISNAQGITLTNMNLTNANTLDGGGAGVCDGLTFTGCNGAIELHTVSGLSITNMTLNGAVEHGIFGTSVTNFDMTNSEVLNAGDAIDENGILISGLFGTSAGGTDSVFTNVTVNNGFDNNIEIRNTTATNTANLASPDLLTLTNSSILNAGTSGILVVTESNANFRLVVDDSVSVNTFTDNASSAIRLNADGGILQSSITGANQLTGSFQVISGGATGTGDLRFDVDGNTISQDGTAGTGPSGIAFSVFDNATMRATIQNNTIGTAQSTVGIFGIEVINEGDDQVIVDIDNNTITLPNPSVSSGSRGIDVRARNGTGSIQATVTNNAVTDANTSFASRPVNIGAGNNTAGEATTVCLNMSGNTVTAGGTNIAIILEQFTGNIFQLQGFAGDGTNATTVANFISGQNNASTAIVNPLGITSFTTANCVLP